MEKINVWEEPTEDFFVLIENQIKNETKEKGVENKQSTENKLETVTETLDDEQDLFNIISENEKQQNQEDINSDNKEVKIEKDNVTDDKNEKDDLKEDDIEVIVESKLENLLNELPEPIKYLNKYVLNGGYWKNFLKLLEDDTLIEDLDMSDEEDQIYFLRTMMKEEGNDEEEIDTQIEYLKSIGKLESLANKKYLKYKITQEDKKEKALKEQEITLKQEKENLKKAKQKTIEFLQTNTINDFDISIADKTELPNYMLDRNVKLSNGSSITKLQYDLFYELPKNEKSLIQLALMVKNRNKDGTFDFSKMEKNIETKITKKLRDNLRNTNNIKVENKIITKQKNLADFF